MAWRYITGFASETERSLRVTLLVLLGLAVLSAALIAVTYRSPAGRRIGLLDSLYSTVQTLTTVGFGDFAFGGQSAWLRVWAIVLMVLGATLVTVVYALLTNLLVSRRIEQSLGRQLVTRMRDHVVVVGLDRSAFACWKRWSRRVSRLSSWNGTSTTGTSPTPARWRCPS